ncbi:MAG TPA: hypothetical protein PKD24_06015 [Pyrinomonadaceae bacterium]|nr:hypothetical protein [Pyrinomonadaceae bacterium]HMP65288.1 hypothetical protein [Pyrinomonadaceae bacterium]
MKNPTRLSLVLIFFVLICAVPALDAQVKRVTHKTDRFDFGVGGTVSIVGAPTGSIRVEGWANREVEISAEIEVQAANDADLAILTKITGFILQETIGKAAITSTGTHDRRAIRKIDRKFPKHLIGVPYRIDYVIKVPRYTDLDINGGKGDLSIAGVEGAIKVNFIETEAKIDLVGGAIAATFGSGSVDLTIPSQRWRGRFVDVSIASGTMNLFLPHGLNADFDATILRTGKIENDFEGFKPKTRHTEFTERSIAAKAGTGTIPLKFTVGDGTMTIRETGKGS